MVFVRKYTEPHVPQSTEIVPSDTVYRNLGMVGKLRASIAGSQARTDVAINTTREAVAATERIMLAQMRLDETTIISGILGRGVPALAGVQVDLLAKTGVALASLEAAHGQNLANAADLRFELEGMAERAMTTGKLSTDECQELKAVMGERIAKMAARMADITDRAGDAIHSHNMTATAHIDDLKRKLSLK